MALVTFFGSKSRSDPRLFSVNGRSGLLEPSECWGECENSGVALNECAW